MTMTQHPLILGDSYMRAEIFAAAFAAKGIQSASKTVTATSHPSWSVAGLREYEGDPAEVSALIDGHEIVALHGAPISAAVLDANPQIRLLACARGGPVNIDLAAAKERGITVTTTPGKNAEAVADLTICFLIASLRHVPASLASVEAIVESGGRIAESAFEGARWFGRELHGRKLGLIGFGRVARLVAKRALALGLSVRAFDPFVDQATVSEVTIVDSLDALLADSDVVSVHARATEQNTHLMGAAQFAQMPTGSVFINTARERLVDEAALLSAIESGHLAGAALDVNEPDGPWRQLVAQPNVLLTPHIAGATEETLARGATMLADEIASFIAGKPLRWAQ